jgi:hypothetical protein
VRPSDSSAEHFQELPITVNVSNAALYFHTHLSAYRVGMRLFVTYPFTFANDPMQSGISRRNSVRGAIGRQPIWNRSSSDNDRLIL